jgi:hypothetical protein
MDNFCDGNVLILLGKQIYKHNVSARSACQFLSENELNEPIWERPNIIIALFTQIVLSYPSYNSIPKFSTLIFNV